MVLTLLKPPENRGLLLRNKTARPSLKKWSQLCQNLPKIEEY